MPRSVYFSQAVKTEQNLYEDLIIESLKIYGQDVYYLPRTMLNRDDILGEDSASKFDDAYMIEAYIENAEGFEGSGDLYSKFGLEIRDEANFIISKRQWEKLIGFYQTNDVNPTPESGDLLFLPMTNKFFEIMFVEHEQPFYQLSNLPVYKLQCSLYEYSDDDFETDVVAIDTVQAKNSYVQTMTVSLTGGDHFEVGETVSQIISTGPTVTVTGEIQTIIKTSDIAADISVSNIGVTGSEGQGKNFLVSPTLGLVGGTSSNTCYITDIVTIGDKDDANTFASDGQAENVHFEIEGDNFIDFTESNPFGDPSETY